MPQDTSAPLAKKPFSLSLSNSNTAPKKTSFNLSSSSSTPSSRDQRAGQSLPRRPHQLHHDDDSGDEADDAPTDEVVTGFDTHTGAVIDADGSEISAEKQRLVIPVASQNNWRDRPGVNRQPKGKKNLLPKEVQAIREAAAKGDPTATGGGNAEVEGPSMAYGISYAQPSLGGGGDDDGDKPMKDADVKADAETEGRKAPRTEDEIALQALIRESNGEAQGGSDLVIESGRRDDELGDLEREDSGVRYDETGSFRADVQVRPDPATLDQYNAIPVEEFGAALLRGMGWKDGQAIGRGNYGTSATADRAIRPRIPERRPGFLGIGAKDVSGGKGAEMELGAWGKSAMRKGSRKAGGDGKEGGGNTEGVYTPVLMRNKQTGDYITEEDLAVAQKQAKKNGGDDEWKERRDRNLEKSGRDRDRDREYRKRDYDDDDESDRYDRRKTGSSRRDRSLSGDRHSRRRRYEDEDGKRRDDRYYRDKERDRERQRGRDKGRDRDRDREPDRSHRYRDDDRHSSTHSSSHTSSRHGRDRDRESESDSYRRRR